MSTPRAAETSLHSLGHIELEVPEGIRIPVWGHIRATEKVVAQWKWGAKLRSPKGLPVGEPGLLSLPVTEPTFSHQKSIMSSCNLIREEGESKFSLELANDLPTAASDFHLMNRVQMGGRTGRRRESGP